MKIQDRVLQFRRHSLEVGLIPVNHKHNHKRLKIREQLRVLGELWKPVAWRMLTGSRYIVESFVFVLAHRSVLLDRWIC